MGESPKLAKTMLQSAFFTSKLLVMSTEQLGLSVEGPQDSKSGLEIKK